MVMAVQPFRATLYVGDLDASVKESDLNGLFLQFGLQSIRLCRDRITHRSLRYGYINFGRYEDAEVALRQLNYAVLKGKPMRIMWSNRNPYTRKAGVGNLFVKNLEPYIGAAQLERVFASFGTVISCKVVYDESSGKSKCFGFVQMSSQAEAQNAISALNNNPSTGISKQLYVGNFVKKNMNGGQEKKNNLYIRNLNPDITNELLHEKFSEFGKVISAVVMKDLNNTSKEFGFVCFEILESAEKALEAMNGYKWGAKELYVAYAQKKEERKEFLKKKFAKSEDTNKFEGYGVYVKNLEESVDEKTLEELFAGCGNILYKRILLDSNKVSRGFGFVYFSSHEEAINAVKNINGSELNSKKINVMHVVPKEKLKRSGTNYNTNTSMGTKINNQSAPITHAYTPMQALQQPYYAPNSYFQNLPFANTYNVQLQQHQQTIQNAWANYNYNYGYNYVPYAAQPTQPVQTKSVFQVFDPYFQYKIPQVNMQGGTGWNTNNTGCAKPGSQWNMNSIFGAGTKPVARNNNNHKRWMLNKTVGPRKSNAPLVPCM